MSAPRIDAINQAQQDRAAALAELQHAPEAPMLAEATLRKAIASLGDVGEALERGEPQALTALYADLRLDLVFQPHERAVLVSAGGDRGTSLVWSYGCAPTPSPGNGVRSPPTPHDVVAHGRRTTAGSRRAASLITCRWHAERQGPRGLRRV